MLTLDCKRASVIRMNFAKVETVDIFPKSLSSITTRFSDSNAECSACFDNIFVLAGVASSIAKRNNTTALAQDVLYKYTHN